MIEMRLREPGTPLEGNLDGERVHLPAVPRKGDQLVWEASDSLMVTDIYWDMDDEMPVLVVRR